MKKVKFDVFGMTCSSCQSHVEKAVNKIDEVKKVNVNLLSNEMLVEFDETKIDEKRIIKAVIDAGYNAKVKTNKERKDLYPIMMVIYGIGRLNLNTFRIYKPVFSFMAWGHVWSIISIIIGIIWLFLIKRKKQSQ